jgi:hypothetical protein
MLETLLYHAHGALRCKHDDRVPIYDTGRPRAVPWVEIERGGSAASDGRQLHRHRDGLGNLAAVMGGSCQEDLVFGTVGATRRDLSSFRRYLIGAGWWRTWCCKVRCPLKRYGKVAVLDRGQRRDKEAGCHPRQEPRDAG